MLAFSPKFEAYTIRLGQSRVPFIIPHSGSDPQTLRWIDATVSFRLLFKMHFECQRTLSESYLLLAFVLCGLFCICQSVDPAQF